MSGVLIDVICIIDFVVGLWDFDVCFGYGFGFLMGDVIFIGVLC